MLDYNHDQEKSQVLRSFILKAKQFREAVIVKIPKSIEQGIE